MGSVKEPKSRDPNRDDKGRFLTGNQGMGGGRKRIGFSLHELMDLAVSKDDWLRIFQTQKVKALDGDTRAAEFLALRRFGQPESPTEGLIADRLFELLGRIDRA